MSAAVLRLTKAIEGEGFGWPAGTVVKAAGHHAAHDAMDVIARSGGAIPPGVYEVVVMPGGSVLIVDAEAIERCFPLALVESPKP